MIRFGSFLLIMFSMIMISTANARPHHHHKIHYDNTGIISQPVRSAYGHGEGRPRECYGIPWCGCWLRVQLGKADKALNQAMAWRRVGTPAAPGCVGCIAGMHRRGGGHVGIVVGYNGSNPIIKSGNHNNRVDVGEYPRSRISFWRYVSNS